MILRAALGAVEIRANDAHPGHPVRRSGVLETLNFAQCRTKESKMNWLDEAY